MDVQEIEQIFKALSSVRVGVIGDFCLDVYADINEKSGELSLETGKEVHYGSNLSASPGGASNVVQNLAALDVAEVWCFGLLGNDLFGRELKRQLKTLGVQTQGMVTHAESQTPVFFKRLQDGIEMNRIDFGADNRPVPAIQQDILDALDRKLGDLDVLIINQQFISPLINQSMVNRLNGILARHSDCQSIADCRQTGAHLACDVLKINASEAAQLLGCAPFDESSTEVCGTHGLALHEKLGRAVMMTRGQNGVLVVQAGRVSEIRGVFVAGETDTVGAGDTFVSCAAASMGAGASLETAAELGNIAAAVVVQKLKQTGTATRQEIIAQARELYYLYRTDLAQDIRRAKYVRDSEIELINPPVERHFKHVILDQDGTISTLRNGWEDVMFDVGMTCICGPQLDSISSTRYGRIAEKLRRMIDVTTGIQTIQQMGYLVEIVLAEGLVDRVLSPAEYKAIYNESLMVLVRDRVARLKRGERDVADFTVKGAIEFLSELRKRPLRLYLASGTDEEDVKHEARILGYADHFDSAQGGRFTGGIFGSRGNEIGDAKRQVIQRIIRDSGCDGRELLVIGDGPVEIREGRKVGAFCIGVASNEIQRYGLNLRKRSRLIQAGADLIIPDFSQLRMLVRVLFPSVE